MKQIRFLGILAILAFILEFVFSFQSAFSDFEEGLKDGMQRTEMEKKDRPSYMVKVNITPKDIKNKDAYIDSYNRNVTNTISQVRTYIKPSLASDLINVPVVISLLASIYGFYLLIRAFISISKRDVFTKKNVWHIRFSCYSSIIWNLTIFVQQVMIERDALNQVIIPGYNITGISTYEFSWTYMAIFVLLTEIFAVSVKIKEEQDLTI